MHAFTEKNIKESLPKLLKNFSFISYNENLSKYTTLHVGGPANAMAQPTCQQDLVAICKFSVDNGIPYTILGMGSNVIPDDRGFKGLIITTRKVVPELTRIDHSLVEASCGILFSRLIIFCQKNGLSGLEWGIGIPGTIGGCIWMNAGASSQVISSFIESITIWDGNQMKTLSQNDVKWGVRYSEFQDNHNILILSAQFRLAESSPAQVKEIINNRLRVIKDSQPRSYPSVGTVFMKVNPSISAGLRVGGMICSMENPRWILNIDNGTSSDFYILVKKIFWKHLWHGSSLPRVEPIFIPYDITTKTSQTKYFNHPPFMIRLFAKFIKKTKILLMKSR